MTDVAQVLIMCKFPVMYFLFSSGLTDVDDRCSNMFPSVIILRFIFPSSFSCQCPLRFYNSMFSIGFHNVVLSLDIFMIANNCAKFLYGDLLQP